MNLNQKRREFIYWLFKSGTLNTHMGRIILNHILLSDGFDSAIHFVKHANYTPSGLVIDCRPGKETVRYYQNNYQKFASDSKDIFDFIVSKKGERLFIEILFSEQTVYEEYADILEDYQKLKSLPPLERPIAIKKETEEVVLEVEIYCIKQKIDAALDHGDEQEFLFWTNELKTKEQTKEKNLI